MIVVSDRATETLRSVRDRLVQEPEQCLRLGPTDEGQLTLFPDRVREGDQVVEHDGVNVLAVGGEVAEALSGRTIDLEHEGPSPRFTVRP